MKHLLGLNTLDALPFRKSIIRYNKMLSGCKTDKVPLVCLL